jgi:Rieske Fe-S protein
MTDNVRRDTGTGDRDPIDVRIETPGREGLTGTTPANLYKRLDDREQITIAPDWRPASAQPAWRQDFPVDWPQDQYVERRDFMKFMVLTSLALTVGQFWIAAQNWLRRRRGAVEIRRIAAVGDLALGSVMTFAYPGPQDDCVLIRTRDDVLVAYSQRCTHLSCAVRPRVDEGMVHCPCHEGYFDLRSGRPIAGPPRRPLAAVHLRVQGGAVYATAVEERTI